MMYAIWDKSENEWITREEWHTYHTMVLVFANHEQAVAIKHDLYRSRNYVVRPVKIVEVKP